MKLEFILSIFVALTLVVPSSCISQDEKNKANIVMKDSIMPEIVTNAEINYSDSARRVAVVTANLLERYAGKNPYVEMRKGVKATFFDKQGVQESILTADYAISYQNEKQVVLKNNVVVKNTKGEQLKTEKLIWDQETGKIHSDAYVKITKPNEILEGHGFESNQDFTNYKIFKLSGTSAQ